MGRAPCCDKANVKKGPWSPEEDATLKDYIEQHGTGSNWIALPQKIGLKRCGKSCRLRWLNYLRPNIKHGSFSEEEDNIICNLYISIGSRWSIIAAQLPGRTDNDIKNYWNTRLKKKLLGKRKTSPSSHSLASLNQETKDSNDVDDNSYPNTLSQSALERLQLHMQLQSLQNPFSFYNNNLALWPKLHPLGDSKCQGHKGLNQNPNPNSAQQIPNTTTTITTESGMSRNSTLFNESPTSLAEMGRGNSINTVQDHELGRSFNGFSPFIVNYSNSVELMNNISKSNSVEQLNMMNYQSMFGSEAELSELLNGENEDQISSEFDSFKEMDGISNGTSNDSMNNIWWSNEFDTKSSSPSNSWDDSTSMSVNLQTDHQGLFQDYVLEYDL